MPDGRGSDVPAGGSPGGDTRDAPTTNAVDDATAWRTDGLLVLPALVVDAYFVRHGDATEEDMSCDQGVPGDQPGGAS
jgi:hypothetical protein